MARLPRERRNCCDLEFEVLRLEQRRLLAGNVTANVIDGNLSISGDGAANNIEVHIGASGSTFITGYDGTTISGNYANSNVDGYVTFNLKGGDDTLLFGAYHVNELKIITGGGGDSITVDSITAGIRQLEIVAGAGDDVVQVVDTTISGNVEINTGGGDDSVSMNDVRVLNEGNLDISTGGGRDQVELKYAEVENELKVITGSGDDSTTISQSEAGELTINSGGGHDVDAVGLTNVFGTALMVSAGGNDELFYNAGSSADQLTIKAGGGNDAIYVEGSNIFSMLVESGGGADDVTLDGSDFTRINLLTGGGNDAIRVTNTFVDAGTNVDTGGGKDDVRLIQSSLQEMEIKLGAGMDDLVLTKMCGTGIAFGGGGSDGIAVSFSQCLSFSGEQFERDISA